MSEMEDKRPGAAAEEEKQQEQQQQQQDDEEEDLEKLQAEIERMEAEAARITKETEEIENQKQGKKLLLLPLPRPNVMGRTCPCCSPRCTCTP
jgi:seryl-tRNA synthetase